MAACSELLCGSCNKIVSSSSPSLFALNEIWHANCFRCSVCLESPGESYYLKDKNLFCREDYMAKFAHSCYKCHTIITGPVMVAGDVRFHPECFMCSKCKRFIGEGDEYTLEDRNCLFCSSCYASQLEKRIGKMKNIVLKGQHTIQHVMLKSNEIGERGIKLQIDKSKNTERKLGDEVLGKQMQPLDKKRKSSISVKSIFKSAQNTPLKAGDKVIEVNGVLVTDETIQEVSKLLRDKPTETLHVTVERNKTNKDVIKESQSLPKIKTSRSEERLLDTENRDKNILEGDITDDKKRERSLSFFNFSVFKRATSDASDWKQKHVKARQRKKLEKSPAIDHSPINTTRKINEEFLRSDVNKKNIRRMIRSRSLTDMECNGDSMQKDMVRAYTTLHRAQSFKTEEQQNSQIFRPSDLIYGDLIGKGFFGDVVKVKHSKTGEEMVMKQLKQVSKDAEETFLNEVQLLKSLKHPNVLGFIGIMYKNKLLHIITEYISGGTLRQLLKNKHQEISWQERVHFAKDIASGVSYLHDMNVIHRDLTSKNCLISNDKHGKTIIVADFGLAKALQQEDPCRSPLLSPLPFPSLSKPPPLSKSPPHPVSPLSDSNSISPTTIMPLSPGRAPAPKKRLTVVGSPFWMAPEMMKGKEYDEKVDIFSFGIILCEMIGRVKSDPDFLPRKFDFGLDEEEFMKMYCKECPESFYRLAFKACCTDPEQRPSFAVLEKWLEAIFVNLEFKIPLPVDIDYQKMPKPLMYKIEENVNTQVAI